MTKAFALLLLAPALLLPAASSAAAQTRVTRAAYGTSPDGAAELYTLRSPKLEVAITTWGAHLTSILAPDRDGKRDDVILGYKDLDGYLADTGKTFMGAIVGRYGNRIAKGTFSLDDQQYHLPTNDGPNMLHGGTVGFDRHNWAAKQIPGGVEMTLVSRDGDQGFPGTLTAHVRYTLLGDALHIAYAVSSDKDTVSNLTSHAYFNLAGHGDILGQVLTIPASSITPVDSTLIPTGKLMPVAGTPFDFRKPTAIGARIADRNGDAGQQMKYGLGYDHNFVLDGARTGLHLAAIVYDPASGRTMTVQTTEPGVQFYSGNQLKGDMHAADGTAYTVHAGLCLETQHFPDSPNQPSFPSTTLKAGQTYRSQTVMRFTAARAPAKAKER